MGLSNTERRNGMFWAIHSLSKLKTDWEEDQAVRDGYQLAKHQRIRDLLGELWHAFLGKQTDSLMWFMGGSATNTITTDEPSTPWEVAIVHHLTKGLDLSKKDDMTIEERERENLFEDHKDFNALTFLDIPGLLRHARDDGTNAAYAYKTYMWIEKLLYYLRRYNDDFTANYKVVSEIASKISGECFAAFQQNEIYAKAYLIHEMMTILYGAIYPYGDDATYDVVTKILNSDANHHDLSALMKWDLKDLVKRHIKLQQAQTKAQRDAEPKGDWPKNQELLLVRLYTALEFLHGYHQYEHKRTKLFQLLEASPIANQIPKVKRELKCHIEQFEANKKSKDKDQSERYHSNAFNAYGFDGYTLLRDIEPKKLVAKRKVKKKPVKKKAATKRKIKKKPVKRKAK